MWSAVTLISTILGGVGGIVALGQWADLGDTWRYGAIGFIVGLMMVLIPGILLWDSPYRQARREREQKKIELVQVLQSRRDRLEQLQEEVDGWQEDVDAADTVEKTQKRLADDSWSKGSLFMYEAHKGASDNARNDSQISQRRLDRCKRELDRVHALTDEQWFEEQAARIYVPD